jgi:hypothetical protein
MKIEALIEQYRRDPQWCVYPVAGLPNLPEELVKLNASIPDSVIRFYQLCGGVEHLIWRDEDLPLKIVQPEKFTWAMDQILGKTLDKRAPTIKENIAWRWCIIGKVDVDDYLFIDLAPERYGRCYFNNFYFFMRNGSVPIVANGFEGLLQKLLEVGKVGEDWVWEDSNLGDAYG